MHYPRLTSHPFVMLHEVAFDFAAFNGTICLLYSTVYAAIVVDAGTHPLLGRI
jgi:hypothetical protein